MSGVKGQNSRGHSTKGVTGRNAKIIMLNFSNESMYKKKEKELKY